MSALLEQARARCFAARDRYAAAAEGSPARAAALRDLDFWQARAAMLRAVLQ